MNAPTPLALLATASRPTTNAEFLAAIFGAPDTARPHVCCLFGDPSDPGKRREWEGWPWVAGAACDAEAMNWYFTLATHTPDASGRYARKRAQFTAIHGAMLDDVGTKAGPLSALRLPPSVVVETSAGNYQALYLYRESVTDLAAADALQDALIAAGLCDPGADGPSARYGRLPFGINGKRSPPFACRLVEWHPERRYTLAEVHTGLGLPPVPARVRKAAAPRLDKWDALDDTGRSLLVEDLRGALAVIPSDDRATWVRTGHRLKADLPEEIGRSLWEEYSERSSKCDDIALEQWETFAPDQTGHAAVFAEAKALGWSNPRARVEADPTAVGFGKCPLPPGARALAQAEVAALVQPAVQQVPFREVDFADIATAPPEPLAWWWGSYIPAGEVSLLSGHGGAGKSYLALMLAVCIAAGRPFLGQVTRPGNVVFFSGEDSRDTIRRRLSKICRGLAIDPASIAGRLRVLDATEDNPVLFAAARFGAGATTDTYRALGDYIAANAVDVLIVDNASDAFDADEINRAQVRAFVRSLALLVRHRRGAVLLLAHVDKQTSRGGRGTNGESYSGSTAWHNSVRSRLFYRKADTGLHELEHEKSNHGPLSPKLVVAWLDGELPRLVADVPGGDAAASAREDADLRTVLVLLHEAYERGDSASVAICGQGTAYSLLSADKRWPPWIKSKDCRALILEADRRAFVARETYRSGNRHERERWQVTGAGRAFAAGNSASAG